MALPPIIIRQHAPIAETFKRGKAQCPGKYQSRKEDTAFDYSIGHTGGSRIKGVEPLLLELHIVSKFTRDNCSACQTLPAAIGLECQRSSVYRRSISVVLSRLIYARYVHFPLRVLACYEDRYPQTASQPAVFNNIRENKPHGFLKGEHCHCWNTRAHVYITILDDPGEFCQTLLQRSLAATTVRLPVQSRPLPQKTSHCS